MRLVGDTEAAVLHAANPCRHGIIAFNTQITDGFGHFEAVNTDDFAHGGLRKESKPLAHRKQGRTEALRARLYRKRWGFQKSAIYELWREASEYTQPPAVWRACLPTGFLPVLLSAPHCASKTI